MIYLLANNLREAEFWRHEHNEDPRGVVMLVPGITDTDRFRGRRWQENDQYVDITRLDDLTNKQLDYLAEIWRELRIMGVPR